MSNFIKRFIHNQRNSNNDSNDQNQSQSVFIQGPSNSNKTAITMNIVHNILSTGNNDNGVMIYILPISKQKNNTFPIPLYHEEQLLDLGNESMSTSYWKEDNLRRIHIKYIPNNDINTLISYILKIPIMFSKQNNDGGNYRILNGIIIEDINDYFSIDNDNNNNNNSVKFLNVNEIMKIIQVVTLLITTANDISKKNNKNIISICTINSKSLLPLLSTYLKNILQNYITTFISITQQQQQQQQQQWIVNIDDDDVNDDDKVGYYENNITKITTLRNSNRNNNNMNHQLYLNIDEENDVLVWNTK